MSRRAVDTFCAQCWTYTLTGADGDRCALNATVDNSPLSRTGELLAVVAGRQVYALDIAGALHRRDRWSIRTESTREPVLAAHVCDQPLPAAWLAPRPTATAPTSTEVPF
jgi:hypothetical protein